MPSRIGEHRHPRLSLYARDQALATARHDHIDGAVNPVSSSPTTSPIGRHQRNRGFRQLRVGRPRHQAVIDARDRTGNCPSRRAG